MEGRTKPQNETLIVFQHWVVIDFATIDLCLYISYRGLAHFMVATLSKYF